MGNYKFILISTFPNPAINEEQTGIIINAAMTVATNQLSTSFYLHLGHVPELACETASKNLSKKEWHILLYFGSTSSLQKEMEDLTQFVLAKDQLPSAIFQVLVSIAVYTWAFYNFSTESQ